MKETSASIAGRLNALLEEAGQQQLDATEAGRFDNFYALLVRWNARMNLTAIRDEEGILRRHFVESIACARALPAVETLLDLGSGAGFPGIPVAICRPEIAVMLAESQNKKAAFLQEAVRTLGLSATVHAGRAESLGQSFGCVALRAVDKMEAAIRVGTGLVAPGGWLALLTTQSGQAELEQVAGPGWRWEEPVALPGGSERIVALGKRDA